MSATRTAAQVLEHDFLEIRARILEVAAAIDRIERADSAASIDDDGRWVQLHEAIELLKQRGSHRAEQIQLLFSDEYTPGWNR